MSKSTPGEAQGVPLQRQGPGWHFEVTFMAWCPQAAGVLPAGTAGTRSLPPGEQNVTSGCCSFTFIPGGYPAQFGQDDEGVFFPHCRRQVELVELGPEETLGSNF